MIRKFASVPAVSVVLRSILITILTGAATLYAQQTPSQDPPADQAPAQQAPAQAQPDSQEAPPQPTTPPQSTTPPATTQPTATQQTSSSQEPSTEEIPAKQPKPRGYDNWTFNVGGGASLTNGTYKDIRSWWRRYRGRRRRPQLQQVFRIASRFPVRQSAAANFGSTGGAGAKRNRSRVLGDPQSHHQHCGDQGLGRIHYGRPRFLPPVGQTRFVHRNSWIGLQLVFLVVGALLQRQPSHQWKLPSLQPKPIWIQLRRRRHAPDSSRAGFLRGIPLSPREARRHHHRPSPDHDWRSLVG